MLIRRLWTVATKNANRTETHWRKEVRYDGYQKRLAFEEMLSKWIITSDTHLGRANLRRNRVDLTTFDDEQRNNARYRVEPHQLQQERYLINTWEEADSQTLSTQNGHLPSYWTQENGSICLFADYRPLKGQKIWDSFIILCMGNCLNWLRKKWVFNVLF